MSQQSLLRAMARNYAGGHRWDHLDTEACVKAADEICALRQRIDELERAPTEDAAKLWEKHKHLFPIAKELLRAAQPMVLNRLKFEQASQDAGNVT